MKVRNIPYGYELQNGEIIISPDESRTIRKIFKEYIAGKSLLEISKLLNERQIEYMPGVIGWNKARIKRIIENEKYTGADKYPLIIDNETFNKVQRLKNSRSTQADTNRNSDIYTIVEYVRCPVCGERMKRRHNDRLKCSETWYCTGKDRNTAIQISDEKLIENITDLLNEAIVNPDVINIPDKSEREHSIEVIKLNNEISRMLNTPNVDKKQLKSKMLICVSEKYKELDSDTAMTKLIKDEFFNAKPPDSFQKKLFERTVEAVNINKDKTITLILKSGQKLKRS